MDAMSLNAARSVWPRRWALGVALVAIALISLCASAFTQSAYPSSVRGSSVTGQVFAPRWFPFGDVNQDFAFLTVHGDVQARAGSEKLGYSAPVPPSVRLEAYSLTGQLTVCNRRPDVIEAAGQQQLRLACPGFKNASSGGPFLIDINQNSGLGTVVGIIGGYQQGGDSPSVSYSSPFAGVLHHLYSSMTTASNGLENLGEQSLTGAG
jgi:hypothetical protein